MTGLTSTEAPVVRDILRMENDLFSSLQAARKEIAHAECFDQEQRAEIYAILKSLSDNTDSHRVTMTALAGGKPS